MGTVAGWGSKKVLKFKQSKILSCIMQKCSNLRIQRNENYNISELFNSKIWKIQFSNNSTFTIQKFLDSRIQRISKFELKNCKILQFFQFKKCET